LTSLLARVAVRTLGTGGNRQCGKPAVRIGIDPVNRSVDATLTRCRGRSESRSDFSWSLRQDFAAAAVSATGPPDRWARDGDNLPMDRQGLSHEKGVEERSRPFCRLRLVIALS
jgi:hypothetical protein